VTDEYNTQDQTHLKGTKGIKSIKGTKGNKGTKGIKETKRFSMLHRKVNKDKFYFSWTPQFMLTLNEALDNRLSLYDE
jgi:hypothetical protein